MNQIIREVRKEDYDAKTVATLFFWNCEYLLLITDQCGEYEISNIYRMLIDVTKEKDLFREFSEAEAEPWGRADAFWEIWRRFS